MFFGISDASLLRAFIKSCHGLGLASVALAVRVLGASVVLNIKIFPFIISFDLVAPDQWCGVARGVRRFVFRHQ